MDESKTPTNGEEAKELVELKALVRCLNQRLSDAADALEWIGSQQDLTFAECSLAETIISRAQEGWRKATGRGSVSKA